MIKPTRKYIKTPTNPSDANLKKHEHCIKLRGIITHTIAIVQIIVLERTIFALSNLKYFLENHTTKIKTNISEITDATEAPSAPNLGISKKLFIKFTIIVIKYDFISNDSCLALIIT